MALTPFPLPFSLTISRERKRRGKKMRKKNKGKSDISITPPHRRVLSLFFLRHRSVDRKKKGRGRNLQKEARFFLLVISTTCLRSGEGGKGKKWVKEKKKKEQVLESCTPLSFVFPSSDRKKGRSQCKGGGKGKKEKTQQPVYLMRFLLSKQHESYTAGGGGREKDT